MSRKKIAFVVMALASCSVAVSCSSNSSGCADGGDAACTAGSDSAAATTEVASDAPALFGLTGGASCFAVVAVDPASVNDGCDKGSILDAATPGNPLVIPFNYDGTTKIVTVGTNGALGTGLVQDNAGTLTRDGSPTDSANAACMWHQTDTSQLVLVADNEFTISVTEMQSAFAAACSPIPAGGSCTSTWTWTMAISNSATPPNCQ
jgi:hypothetical protein